MAHPAAGSDLALIAVTFALALAAAPSPAGGAGACTLLNLAACPDVGPLARDEAFQTALKAFVGQRRTGYLTPNGQAYGEAIAALGGPAEPARRLRNLYVFTACADASCDDQGAVVLQPDGELAAAAILHTDCNSTRRTSDCVDRQVLSILRRQNDDFSVIDTLSDWARRSLADRPIAPGAGIKNLDRVEVVALDGLAPEPPAAAPALGARPGPVARPAPASRPVAPPAKLEAPEPVAPKLVAPPQATPAPAAKAEPIEEPPPNVQTAPSGPVTSVESVTSVVQPLAPRIAIPLKVYVTLKTDVPAVVIVPPPPPPPPPKPKRPSEMWKWHWTPFD